MIRAAEKMMLYVDLLLVLVYGVDGLACYLFSIYMVLHANV